MIESILPNVLLGIAANRLDRHVVGPALDKLRGDPTIDEALRDAWRSAADELFGAYRATREYDLLNPDEKNLVEARLDWLKEDNTFDHIFRGPRQADDAALLAGDPAGVFLVAEDRARRDLFVTLDQLGIVEGLPGGLVGLLQRALVSELRTQVIRLVVVGNENTRDTVFFGEFVAIRQALGDTNEEWERAWQDVLSRYEAFAQEHSSAISAIMQQLYRIEAKVDRQRGAGSPSFPPVESIGGFAALTGGLEALPEAVLTKVEGFLAEYLGLPDSPTPFGGREDEIAALDSWLAEPSKPYALLVAPTGRGKSALVSQWIQAVAASERAHVAFLPVSLRFDTARPEVAFAILGARLRRILSPADGAPCPDAGHWLREIDAYLRAGRPQGAPLLVVIDGADEAIGWSLGRDLVIPPSVAPGLKVLVSARPLPADDEAPWQTRLNWSQHQARSFELPALGLSAVRQLVLHQGIAIADPAHAEHFAQEVYRLSGGDPILVKLYVQLGIDRTKAGSPLNADELQTIDPGLAGYFRREWDGLVWQWDRSDPRQEDVAHALLNVFSCARGPVTRADLVALTKPEGGSGLRVELAVAALRRLVIGNAASGYVFGHPRFGQFFREELFTPEEVRDWETRITDYGRRIVARLNAGELAPADVPRYVLEHHAGHLVSAAAAPSELFALITRPWLLAWEGTSGTYDGFLDDLHRAWAVAEQLGTAAIVESSTRTIDLHEAVRMQLRAALLASSIRGLAGSIPVDLLRQLVEIGRWTPLQGIAYAGAMPSDPQRKAALCAVAGLGHPLPGHPTLEAVGGIRDPRTRVEALACVLPRLDADIADLAAAEALSLVPQFQNLDDRVSSLEAIVPVLPDSLVDQAIVLGASVPSGFDRVRALAVLAMRKRGAAKVRLVKEALAETETCDDRLQVLTLQLLVPLLTASTLPAALALAEDVEAPLHRARALLALLPRLPGSARREAIGGIERAMERVDADDRINLRIVLLDWVDDGDLSTMLDHLHKDAQEATTPGSRQRATTVIAQFLLANNGIDDAMAFVDASFAGPASIASAIVELAGVADGAELPRLVDEFRDAIREVNDGGRHALLLAELLAVAPEPMTRSLGADAMAAARREPVGLSRAERLATVAQVLPQDERGAVLDEALATASGVDNEWHFDSAVGLCELLNVADPAERPIVFWLAMGTLPRIGRLADRAYVISLLLPYAEHEAARSRLAGEALDALIGASEESPGFDDRNPIGKSLEVSSWERYRVGTLRRLLPFLDDRLLRRTLGFARSVDYPSVEVEMLVETGRHLNPEERQAVLEEARGRVPQVAAEASRAHLYGLLYGAVDPELRDDLIAAIAEIEDPHARAMGYVSLLEHHPDAPRPEIESLAREAIAAIQRPQDRYWMFMYLASLLPQEERGSLNRRAVAAAGAIPGEWERMVRLGEVATHVDGEERVNCLEAAAAVARALPPINGRWQALSFLVCRLMELGLDEMAKALVHEIADETVKAQANVCVSARLGERFEIDAAIQVAEGIGSPERRAELLVTVAEHAPLARRRDCLEKALSAALAVPRDHDRTPLLNLLVPLLEELSVADHYSVWSRALRTMGSGDRRWLLTNLRTMMPAFVRVGGQSTILAIAEAIAETDLWFSAEPRSTLP